MRISVSRRCIAALLTFLLVGCTHEARVSEPPIAQVAEGRLAGAWEDGVAVYRGAPYASPPVGERRWRAPGAPSKWRGVRSAVEFGPSCMQPPYPAHSVYFELLGPMSEDCLTLSVWAPAHARRAPVIVWIHGGALTRGGSASPMYDGGAFAKRGIVFISINYRLGVFGWLAHPALSAESPEGISGNYGLQDQIAALRWVRDNVAAFGGDPGAVTIMGESAGALSVSYLVTSPRARGLFARAILQSVNIRAVPHLQESAWGLPSAEGIGSALAETLGARTVGDLRAAGAESLMAAAQQARFVAQGTVDGVLLPAQVIDAFDRGEQAKTPILTGFNSGEVRSQRELVPKPPPSSAQYVHEIERRYLDLAPAFLRLYPASNMEQSLLAATRDAVYGWSSERIVQRHSAAGVPAYLYIFDHCHRAARERDLCAFHAGELPFIFADPDGRRTPPNWPRPGGAADRRVSDLMLGYWVNFAKGGVQPPDGAPTWRPYSAEGYFLRFAETPALERDLFPGMFELYEALADRRRARGEQWLTGVGAAAPLPQGP